MPTITVDDGWEARMAARAAARAKTTREREAQERWEAERNDERLRAERPWLHGWPRLGDGTAVLMGTGTRCVGCGRFQGTICVAFPEDWAPPGPEPDWPFAEPDCPVCLLYRRLAEHC